MVGGSTDLDYCNAAVTRDNDGDEVAAESRGPEPVCRQNSPEGPAATKHRIRRQRQIH